MNPLSNHQIGQARHREYEATYGNSYNGMSTRNEEKKPLRQQKMALALSSAFLATFFLALARLF